MTDDQDNNLFSRDDPTDTDKAARPVPFSLIIVAGIILTTILLIAVLVVFKPEAKKQEIPELIIKVNTIEAQSQDYPIQVSTNGSVAARVRGNLVAQVSGDIISAGSAFTSGGTFKKGDLLLEIDNRNYLSELSRTQAALSQAQAAYRQEKANSKQAAADWQRLGNTEPAPDMVLRKPQLAAAQAQLKSTEAALGRAKLDLDRTKIRAPYTGQMIRDNVSLGQYVTIGTPVAEIFKTDEVEVHLPISQTEYVQLGFGQVDFSTNKRYVELTSEFGGKTYQWQAQITGTDGIFDQATRQTNVIAKITNSLQSEANKPNLKLGQFVDALIVGRTIKDVVVVPNESVREGNSLFVAEDGRLARKLVDILWQDDKNTLIRSGISQGDQVVTTALSTTVSGARVEIKNKPEKLATDQASKAATEDLSAAKPAQQPATKTN